MLLPLTTKWNLCVARWGVCHAPIRAEEMLNAAEISLVNIAQLQQALSLPVLLYRCVSIHIKHIFPLFIRMCALLQKTGIVIMQQSISSALAAASPSGELQREGRSLGMPGDADCLLAAENKCKVSCTQHK